MQCWLVKILHARDTDQRSLTFEKTLEVGENYLWRVKSMILRSAVLRNNIHVQVFLILIHYLLGCNRLCYAANVLLKRATAGSDTESSFDPLWLPLPMPIRNSYFQSRKSPKKDEIETDCGQWSLLLALCFRDSAK